MELALDLTALVLALILISIVAPLLIASNGRRPFIVGYLGITLIILPGALFAPWISDLPIRVQLGIVAMELLLLGTLLWAWVAHRRHST